MHKLEKGQVLIVNMCKTGVSPAMERDLNIRSAAEVKKHRELDAAAKLKEPKRWVSRGVAGRAQKKGANGRIDSRRVIKLKIIGGARGVKLRAVSRPPET